jgi:hypothetical protein
MPRAPHCAQFLKRTIQSGQHDSTEDARAAVDLAILKVSKGACACVPLSVCMWGRVGQLPASVLASDGHGMARTL